ncbi:MAG: MMPL family transporter [Pseudomonadota bacterium]
MNAFSTRRRAAALLALFLLITGVFVWLNLGVPAAGIVQNALLDKDNPYYRAQQRVDAVKGLKQGDAVSFVLAFPNGIDAAGMRQITQMTADLRQRFAQGVVWSLAADSYAYKADAHQLDSAPHLSASWFDAGGQLHMPMSMEAWKRSVAGDPAAFGMLVGRDFKYAQILLWMPNDYNELRLVQQVAEYLEQRPISQLEWLLLKGDIKPVAAYANVTLGGWSVGRGLMHFALMSDVLFYSTIGLIIATLAALLALKSLKQALYSSACILTSFILVRGTITLCSMLGLEFYGAPLSERVYFLLVLSAMIVGGISFNIRALERFNELQARHPQQPHHALWAKVEGMHLPLNVAAIIAFLNFATLPQIGIRGIMEVGVLSAIGIVFQRVLVSAMLPALQLTFGGVAGEKSLLKFGRLQGAWERAITAVPTWCHALIVRLNERHAYGAAIAAALVCCATVGAALAVVAHDMRAADKWILVQEKPIDYLPHTIVDRGRQLLNEPGHIGFGRLSYLVQPAAPHGASREPVADPRFLQQAQALQQRLSGLPGARGANSVLDTLSYLTAQDATMPPGNGEQRPLPQTAQQAHEQFQQISWDLSQPALARYLWTKDGLVLYLSHPADNSTELRQFAEQVERVAAAEFPQLRILPFGALHTYHQTDLYISEGKPLNVLTSFPLVVLCCAAWLSWSMRRKRARQAQRHDQAALRPWLTALAMTVPFLFAYAVIVVLMAAFKIPLDQATACATALGINAAIDFDLYLIDDYRQALDDGKSAGAALHYALAERGHITLTDAALNAICFSFLLCSPFLPIQRLGAIMLVMVATCALGALLLMPALLPLCSRMPRVRLSTLAGSAT